MKNQVSEWIAALMLIAIILVVFMFGGVLLTSIAIVCFCGLVLAATLDIIGWSVGRVLSLFPSTKEKGKGERDGSD